jgi:hypothetical protein
VLWRTPPVIAPSTSGSLVLACAMSVKSFAMIIF